MTGTEHKTTTVCPWFKGITAAEANRRGVQTIALPRFAVGDRVVMKDGGRPATVVAARPMLHPGRDSDWIYEVAEAGGRPYHATGDRMTRPSD